MKAMRNLCVLAITSMALACGCKTSIVPAEQPELPSLVPDVEPESRHGPAETFGNEFATIRPSGGDYGPLPDFIRHAGRELTLNGVGLCEWGIFGLDLYRGALYVEQTNRDAAALMTSDEVGLIHLHFVRSLTRQQLAQAFTASVGVNAADRADEYVAALGVLCESLVDVDAGDTLTFTSLPGRGLVVQSNGAVVAEIDDEPFRKLFLRLYLGDKPPTTALREAMLGDDRSGRR